MVNNCPILIDLGQGTIFYTLNVSLKFYEFVSYFPLYLELLH